MKPKYRNKAGTGAVSLAMRNAARVGVACALMFAGGCGESPAPEAPGPNIVLVSIDTLRADRVGERPGQSTLTPRVDQVAQGGTVFEYAISPTGTTWPSHATMLTGLYPRYHGLRSNSHRLPDDVGLVSELLSKANYATGSFVSFKGMHFLGGLGRGFETLSDPERPGQDEGAIRDGRETMDMALAWLREQSRHDRPVFLWLHLFEPHGPYDPTDYSRAWMRETGYDGLVRDGASMNVLLEQNPGIVRDPDELEAIRVLYDGEVNLADRYFGELVEALRDTARIHDTVIIFTSDHGQSLGENGHMGHGPTLRQEVLDVPLVIRDFRERSAQPRIEELVGLVDVAPTIADLALEVSLPGVQGRSLVPLIRGKGRQGEPKAVEYLGEVALKKSDEVGDWYDPDAVAVFSHGLEFLLHRDRPFEVRNPSGNHHDAAPPAVDEAVRAYIEDLAREFLAGESRPVDADLDARDIETLRSLGYIQ